MQPAAPTATTVCELMLRFWMEIPTHTLGTVMPALQTPEGTKRSDYVFFRSAASRES